MNIKGIATTLLAWDWECKVRNKVLEDHFDEVFAMIASAGFDGIESRLNYYTSRKDAERLERLLSAHFLKQKCFYGTGIYYDLSEGSKAIKQTIELARHATEVGGKVIDINTMPKSWNSDVPKTDDELKIQAENLNQLGKALKEIGMELVVHNHAQEIYNGAQEIRSNCKNTDPRLVNLCLDIAWVCYAGGDPVALIREFSNRIHMLHLRNLREHVWTETLEVGDIDYSIICAALNEVDFNGWLVIELSPGEEVAQTRSLLENEQMSINYIRTLLSGQG